MKVDGQSSASVSSAGFTTISTLVAEGTVSGTPVYVNLEGKNPPYSVSIYPGSGCVCTVKTCNLTGAAGDPPAASNWEEWEPGEVSSAFTAYLTSPIAALEISRVSGAAASSYVVRGL